MKKLTKLVIHPEKVMKNEELKTLRGGTDNPTSFYCKLGSEVLGCFTLPTCSDDIILNTICRDIFGGDTCIYSCGYVIPQCIEVFYY